MKIGDLARVNSPRDPWHGKVVHVERSYYDNFFTVRCDQVPHKTKIFAASKLVPLSPLEFLARESK